jgi:hypothetical protein
MNLFSEAVLQSWLSVAYPDTFPPGSCLKMQLYFRCLVTMLIPPLQVKDNEVKKTLSSDQLSSSPHDYNL